LIFFGATVYVSTTSIDFAVANGFAIVDDDLHIVNTLKVFDVANVPNFANFLFHIR